ncbi:unnamed protein product [Anisakis simplex]|uniref:VP2 n=1 Tax=Anisakis simplex TaxID=6269 RepID=A0A0M3K9X4_ANISI|nr:unnamed protein product [Anisakis simplex]
MANFVRPSVNALAMSSNQQNGQLNNAVRPFCNQNPAPFCNSGWNSLWSGYMNNMMRQMHDINDSHRAFMSQAMNQMQTAAANRNDLERLLMEMNARTQQAIAAINNINFNLSNPNAFNQLIHNIANSNPTPLGNQRFSNNISYSFRNWSNAPCCNDPCCNQNCVNCSDCVDCPNCKGPSTGSFSFSQVGFRGENPQVR